VAPRLAALSSEGKIALHWLEWPIYGGRSVEVARALIAAEETGQADALRGPLYAGPPRPLSRVVDEAGLSRDLLRARMDSDSVARRLSEITQAAELLRLYGTPSMMVGRTLVVGAPPAARLDRLIEIEAAEGPLPCF
jgi:2-hydroxychromene-2-carboxylate isomerase